MPSYTINGVSLQSCGVLDARLSLNVGRPDELEVTTNSTSESSLAGSGLLSYVSLYWISDSGVSYRVFYGKVDEIQINAAGGSTTYTWKMLGVLSDLDSQGAFSTAGDVNIALGSIVRSEVEQYITVPSFILDTYRITSTTIPSRQRFTQNTKGDVLRYVLGLIGNYHTFVDYMSTPKLNIYDMSLGLVSSRPASNVISFSVNRKASQMNGFRFSYATELRVRQASAFSWTDIVNSTVTSYPEGIALTRDTSGTIGTSYSAGAYKIIEGYQERREFSYYTQPGGYTVGQIFSNSSNYTYKTQLQYIMSRVNKNTTDLGSGQLVTTSASLSLLGWHGLQPSSFNISNYYFSDSGVPFAEMLNSALSSNIPVAMVRGQIYVRPTSSLTPYYVDVTFPAISSAPGYRSYNVNVYETPQAGLASIIREQQNASQFTGSLQMYTTEMPYGAIDRVTYNGITYTGVKQAIYNLKTNILTYSFGGTADLSQRDYVRTLRDIR